MLHLGGEAVVPVSSILMILDMPSADTPINREFFQVLRDEGFTRNVSPDAPKSAVLVEKDGQSILYLSPISSLTLLKRARSALPLGDSMSVSI